MCLNVEQRENGSVYVFLVICVTAKLGALSLGGVSFSVLCGVV